MRKTITKKVDVDEEKYYCDCCGNEFQWGYCSSEMNQCWVCKNYMCDNCRRNSSVDNDTDLRNDAYDRTRYICKDCAKSVEPYMNELNNIWEKYLNEKERIHKNMRTMREKEKGKR